jgi:hypothetical protein
LLLNHPDSLDIYIDNLFPKIPTKQCNDRTIKKVRVKIVTCITTNDKFW